MKEENKDERPAARPIRPTPEQERNKQIEDNLQETLRDIEKSKKTDRRILWIGVPVVTIGFFIAALSLGWFEPSSTAGYGQAKIACERAVEAKLLSPSSADVTTLQYAQHNDIPENWMISGEVTAENAFGAELTRPWRCFYEDGQPLVFID
jgi:hypothetical protein